MKKGTHACLHTYNEVTNSPFQNLLGSSQLGVSQEAFKIKENKNPGLKGIEKKKITQRNKNLK